MHGVLAPHATVGDETEVMEGEKERIVYDPEYPEWYFR
jgi:hypothetical protein